MEPSINGNGPVTSGKPWKFFIWFLVIIAVGYIGYVVIYNVVHWDEIQSAAKLQEDMEAWKDIYRNDKAGGATPQETLDLLIAALEAGDVELATSYYMPDDYGKRDEPRAALEKAKAEGRFPEIAADLKLAKPDPEYIIADKFYGFTIRDADGNNLGGILLQFNGNVWKIE